MKIWWIDSKNTRLNRGIPNRDIVPKHLMGDNYPRGSAVASLLRRNKLRVAVVGLSKSSVNKPNRLIFETYREQNKYSFSGSISNIDLMMAMRAICKAIEMAFGTLQEPMGDPYEKALEQAIRKHGSKHEN